MAPAAWTRRGDRPAGVRAGRPGLPAVRPAVPGRRARDARPRRSGRAGAASKTCYALTDRRAIVWSPAVWSGVQVRSYGPEELRLDDQEPARRRLGRPDLRGDHDLRAERGERRASPAAGFLAIDRVQEVEALIRSTLLARLRRPDRCARLAWPSRSASSRSRSPARPGPDDSPGGPGARLPGPRGPALVGREPLLLVPQQRRRRPGPVRGDPARPGRRARGDGRHRPLARPARGVGQERRRRPVQRQGAGPRPVRRRAGLGRRVGPGRATGTP